MARKKKSAISRPQHDIDLENNIDSLYSKFNGPSNDQISNQQESNSTLELLKQIQQQPPQQQQQQQTYSSYSSSSNYLANYQSNHSSIIYPQAESKSIQTQPTTSYNYSSYSNSPNHGSNGISHQQPTYVIDDKTPTPPPTTKFLSNPSKISNSSPPQAPSLQQQPQFGQKQPLFGEQPAPITQQQIHCPSPPKPIPVYSLSSESSLKSPPITPDQISIISNPQKQVNGQAQSQVNGQAQSQVIGQAQSQVNGQTQKQQSDSQIPPPPPPPTEKPARVVTSTKELAESTISATPTLKETDATSKDVTTTISKPKITIEKFPKAAIPTSMATTTTTNPTNTTTPTLIPTTSNPNTEMFSATNTTTTNAPTKPIMSASAATTASTKPLISLPSGPAQNQSYKRPASIQSSEPSYKRRRAYESTSIPSNRQGIDTYIPKPQSQASSSTSTSTPASSFASVPKLASSSSPTLKDESSKTDYDFAGFEKNRAHRLYNETEILKYLKENKHHPKLKIAFFTTQADHFLKLAHESIVKDKTCNFDTNYRKFIKAAIKSLLILLKKYDQHMWPELKISTYFKLAKIYFDETESYELADKYINKAIVISKKDNLPREGFFCDLLLIQIYEKIDLQAASSFIGRRIDQYQDRPSNVFGQCFKLMRIRNLLVTETSLAFIHLQRLLKEQTLNHTIKKIANLYLANLLTHRGDPAKAIEIIKNIDESKETKHPFKAYILMTRLLAFMSLNQYAEAKSVGKQLVNVISECEKSKWNHWLPHGEIKFTIKVDPDDYKSGEIKFLIPWLTVAEFKIIFYLITSVSIMHGKKEQASVGFEKALKSLTKAKNELRNNEVVSRYVTIETSRQKIIKLKFLRYLVQFYQQWFSFLNNDMKIQQINEFMIANNEFFTKEEYIIFKSLYANMYYIIGIYYHSKGDIQAAKYYYLKVRNMTTLIDQSPSVSLVQLNAGIGCYPCNPQGRFSELYIFSTIQLVMLLDFEIDQMLEIQKSNKLMLINETIRNQMGNDLALALQSSKHSDIFRQNFISRNEISRVTINIIMSILHNVEPPKENFRSILNRLGDNTYFYLIYFLVSIAYSYTAYSGEKLRILKTCSEILPSSKALEVDTKHGKMMISSSESSDSCRVFLLRDLIQGYLANGDRDKVEMINLQLERFCELLENKYETLTNNVIYDSDVEKFKTSN
ncbi:hypothetical protein KGF54_004901 [Candida jiufengensis]|uniref:uncharacterized protein n=1 Tax=Candida jiufengensis TaxID=497108 RepID=UPI002225360A|nr:uncharacterized protein KGF54_004901 [Candida jiufengensis]KAI5951826.1 hypothetical protein KGF54_004901 [Candida jiufengensis]